MEKKYSSQVPEKVERYASYRVLNYNVRETTEAEILEEWKYSNEGEEPSEDFVDTHKYVYYTLRIPTTQWSYGGIVNAIIRDKYQVEEMESITNNVTAVVSEFFEILVVEGIISATKFLSESFRGGLNTTDFREMQEWRLMAKREAKSVLKL